MVVEKMVIQQNARDDSSVAYLLFNYILISWLGVAVRG